ncbi:cryptochrome/photolyase family protein [Jannaschia aquimarina]|uniref:Deoxyribodipyrimidine photo-lyase-related protein n=1 Tax=Jannaschia aquimarina TaxID=935700 RepID=A0A0D1EF14_9RHOB|nr:cryptochrome/photolyase family protein [Jannaschia aquimarina]KIT14505.1 Deoxyribodipyrimidine photo-lyase-related protein [Jannaschia aquimarina]SNT28427.1 deoxyribodipyrimidine photolyase-related protein [Jannaschia aquimarina]
MVKRLILVLGDQLSDDLSALREGDKETDIVVMAEVRSETDYVAHHPKKIAFLFAAMRKHAERLRADGWDVRYSRLDDTENTQSIPGELIRYADETGAEEVLATEPGEFRLIDALEECPIPVHLFPDDRFLCSHAEFEAWAEGRKELRMEWFYREMRRKTGLLMEGDKPAGGKWNYDAENRKPPKEGLDPSGPMKFTPDKTVQEVLDLVAAQFGNRYGSLDDFWFATEPGQARRALAHFIRRSLPTFGDFQDAMVTGEPYMFHALLSPYINAGLLGWREVCEAAVQAYEDGDAPLNAVEGFVRQIIGWREYIRGIYFLEGPDYPQRNGLGHDRDLPEFYWTGDTDMHCLKECVTATMDNAYAHHIQRLMVTGNFALLAGLDPQQVSEWYLIVYADAYEWVEAPNVVGMSQFADGGVVASKPYVSGGNYINRMSDYCKHCSYSVSTKTGEGACPFNLLYWHFLNRHRERFENNPRMAQMYRSWDRMDEGRRETVITEGDAFLQRLSAGNRV